MSSEEFEQLIKEARMAGLKGDIKSSMIKYINVMSQLEMEIDNACEEQQPPLKAKLQECVDEYNTLRSGHPDVTIFTDELDRHSVVDDVLTGVSSVIQYGVSGVKSFLETAAVYGTVAMGDISNYIADYLDDGETTVQTDESESVVENSLSREASVKDSAVVGENVSVNTNPEGNADEGTAPSVENKDSQKEQPVEVPTEIAVEVEAQPESEVKPVATEQSDHQEEEEEKPKESLANPEQAPSS